MTESLYCDKCKCKITSNKGVTIHSNNLKSSILCNSCSKKI